jgi:hypothetical protein
VQNLFFLLLLGLFFNGLQAQNCNCDHVFTNLSTTDVNIIHASTLDYAPGDTFCIPGGQIAGLRLLGFKGTAAQPLTFINCDGPVVINELPHSGITFIESEHIRLTGSGDPNYEYGFHITQSGPGQVGISVTTFSTDIEIDHIEIENTGFAGIMAKTDPRCDDPATWRVNGFVLRNLNIHHNYIHHTSGEGIYVGYAGGYLISSNVICDGQYRFGHWLENIDIHHNLLENIGWDGIQLNLIRTQGKVHDNTIINWATSSEFYQDFVLNLIGGTYEVYNNFILSSGENQGKGMQVISAQSGSKFYNNTLVNPSSHGIFFHARHQFDNPLEGYYIVNNTIIRPERSGFFYDAEIKESMSPSLLGTRQNDAKVYFVNNLVVDPGTNYGTNPTWKLEPESFFDFNTPDTRDAQLPNIYGNFTTRRLDTIHLANPAQNLYAPTPASSGLIDRGSPTLPINISFDLENDARPVNGAFDIGAYELQDTPTSSTLLEVPSAFSIYPNPGLASQLMIDLPEDETEVRITDTNGQLRYHAVLHQGPQKLSLPDFPEGVYWVNVRHERYTETQRVVVY